MNAPDHPSNSEFKELFFDDRIGDKGRNELTHHIQKPFYLMDIIKEDNDEWNFEDDQDINVYTYSSCLGMLHPIALLSFILQLLLPFIIWNSYYCGKYEKSQSLERSEEKAKWLALLIYLYYFSTILPDAYYKMSSTVGSSDTVYSRLNSLRRNVWMKGCDTLIQQLFYKIDLFMNTAHISLLSMLNVYVLSKELEPINVVLDSLAFFFIARIDEEFARAQWWDPNRRWVRCLNMCEIFCFMLKLLVLASTVNR